MSYNCIIFDLDGTLIDSKRDLVISANFALRKFGLPEQKPETIYPYIGFGLRNLMVNLIPPKSDIDVDDVIRVFRAHYREHCLDTTKLLDGAEELISYLFGRKLAVVTNKTLEPTEIILRGLGVLDKFQVILGHDSVENKKPHPEPIFKTIEILKVGKNDAIMVGDSHIDVQAGKAAGIATCGLKNGIGGLKELLDSSPDYIIDNLLELKEIVL